MFDIDRDDEDDSEDDDAGAAAEMDIDDDRDYTYKELLDRVFSKILKDRCVTHPGIHQIRNRIRTESGMCCAVAWDGGAPPRSVPLLLLLPALAHASQGTPRVAFCFQTAAPMRVNCLARCLQLFGMMIELRLL